MTNSVMAPRFQSCHQVNYEWIKLGKTSKDEGEF